MSETVLEEYGFKASMMAPGQMQAAERMAAECATLRARVAELEAALQEQTRLRLAEIDLHEEQEGALVEAVRAEERERCAGVICLACRSGLPRTERDGRWTHDFDCAHDTYNPNGYDWDFCPADALHRLTPEPRHD